MLMAELQRLDTPAYAQIVITSNPAGATGQVNGDTLESRVLTFIGVSGD
jgi:hypothetical protein